MSINAVAEFAILKTILGGSRNPSAFCRASVPAPKPFGVHRAEPRGRGRHRREARRVKLAGASESNALQSKRNLFGQRLA